MPESNAVSAVADVATGQWGLFTTSQARREGLSAQALARLADAGQLERLRHGVYRIIGTSPHPAERLQAAWLALQPALMASERIAQEPVEVVSHLSAADLLRLGDVGADRLEFTAAQRRQARDKEVRFHRGTVSRAEWTLVDGLPTTTPLRTIIDLAHDRLDGDHLAGIVRDAITTLHLDTTKVADALCPYAHHYGAPLGDGRTLLADLLQRAGIPEATRSAVQLVTQSHSSDLQIAMKGLASPAMAELLSSRTLAQGILAPAMAELLSSQTLAQGILAPAMAEVLNAHRAAQDVVAREKTAQGVAAGQKAAARSVAPRSAGDRSPGSPGLDPAPEPARDSSATGLTRAGVAVPPGGAPDQDTEV